MNGTLHEVDGRNLLRFERRLAHPAEMVWSSITDPADLANWFPASVDLELELGGTITFDFPEGEAPTLQGEIVEYEPPFIIGYTWGEDLLRFELQPRANDCVLVFTHAFENGEEAAKFAAGWHICLDGLGGLLDGREADVSEERWSALYGRYVVTFS